MAQYSASTVISTSIISLNLILQEHASAKTKWRVVSQVFVLISVVMAMSSILQLLSVTITTLSVEMDAPQVAKYKTTISASTAAQLHPLSAYTKEYPFK